MNYSITAFKRTNLAKRAKDELLENRIPAVIYGRGLEAQTIAVSRPEFLRVLKAAGYSSLVDVTFDESSTVKALIKDVQVDPISMEPVHIDFHQVRMDEEITAAIPLNFIGESKAVKTEGGTLVKSLDELEVKCLPGNLPHMIDVSLESLNTFDDAITVADVKLPEGVVAVTDNSVTIATVARPLTDEQLKKMEETGIGDVTAVKAETDEKKAEREAKDGEAGDAAAT